jgi:hypothetical protein
MINILEILKNSPKDTPLYSPIFGECKLSGVCEEDTTIYVYNKLVHTVFDSYGRYCDYGIIPDAECLLFPSKENHNWNTFEQSQLAKYSTETLRAELKRRNAEEKAIRQKEFDSAHRCRNCKFFEKEQHPFLNSHICRARTWGKTTKRHYIVNGSHGLQCDRFVHK